MMTAHLALDKSFLLRDTCGHLISSLLSYLVKLIMPLRFHLKCIINFLSMPVMRPLFADDLFCLADAHGPTHSCVCVCLGARVIAIQKQVFLCVRMWASSASLHS